MDNFAAGVALGVTTSVLFGFIVYVGWKYTSILGETRWRRVGALHDIIFYPLKSGAGISLEEASCDVHGLHAIGSNSCRIQDRCFVAFDSVSNAIVTCREYPKLVLIKWKESGDNYVTFEAPDATPITVVKPRCMKENRKFCSMWNGDTTYVMDFGDAAGRWLSGVLGIVGTRGRVHLGYFCPKYCQGRNFGTSLKNMREIFPRITKRDFGIYSDFAPYTIISQASVLSVNGVMGKAGDGVTAEWFRPNFIVVGPEEFDEDSWNYIKIGDAVFQNVMPCHRDVSCCVNPNTGAESTRGEPFKSLLKSRRKPGRANNFRGMVSLGVGLGVREVGRVKVGDEVFVAQDRHFDF